MLQTVLMYVTAHVIECITVRHDVSVRVLLEMIDCVSYTIAVYYWLCFSVDICVVIACA